MWRIAFLFVVLIGVLAVTMALMFGMGVWRAARLQAGAASPDVAPSTMPATQPAPAAVATSKPPADERVAVAGDAEQDRRQPEQPPVAVRPLLPPVPFPRPQIGVDPRAFGRLPPPLPEPLPGAGPPPIPPEAPKPLVLSVKDAVIHGDDLRLEGKDVKTAVNWQVRSDSLEWAIDVPRTGLYAVEIEYSCDPREGGGVISMYFSGLRHVMIGIPVTNGWDDYRTLVVGKAILPAGPSEVAIRPTFLIPDHFLMNLRSVKLTLLQEVQQVPDMRPPSRRGLFRRFD